MEAHLGSPSCRLAQRSESTGVQLPLSAGSCCLGYPGKLWQRASGPEYLGFPLNNTRIIPEIK